MLRRSETLIQEKPTTPGYERAALLSVNAVACPRARNPGLADSQPNPSPAAASFRVV